MSNSVITAVQQLSENIRIPNTENVVCIDTQNNRIGINTSQPNYDIEVSGNNGTIKSSIIKTNNLIFENSEDSTTSNDISFNNSFLYFNNKIHFNSDLCVNNIIDTSLIITNDISSLNIHINNQLDVSTIFTNSINNSNNIIDFNDCSLININNIDVSTILTNSINNSNNIINFNDCSFININNIDVSTININGLRSSLNTILFDVSRIIFSGDVSFNGDVSFTQQTIDSLPTSDDRLKHNEIIINNGLEIIRQLEPQFYQKTSVFRDIDFSGTLNIPYILEAGLIAQDVLNINDISYTVTIGNETTPYLLKYNDIFVYGLAAIKELDRIVSGLNILSENSNLVNFQNFMQSQSLLIETLNNRILNLENKINILENKI